MATTRSALTDEDVRSLVKGATSDERALAARKLCATMDRGPLSDADRALAGDILRVMAADAAELVRLGGGVRQVAIAKRPTLSRVVTDSLAENGGENAVSVACSNPGADFADSALNRIVDRFEASDACWVP